MNVLKAVCTESIINCMFQVTLCSVLNNNNNRDNICIRFVALYEASILQKGLFWAASVASSSSMSNEVRPPLMFLSQVEHGCPGGLLQNSSGGLNSIRLAYASPSMRAICPNSERRLLLTMEESGGCSVMRRISSFLTKSYHRMLRIRRRHHLPSASICNTSAEPKWSIGHKKNLCIGIRELAQSSNITSAKNPVVDEERVKTVGNFPQLRSVLWASFSALTLFVR